MRLVGVLRAFLWALLLGGLASLASVSAHAEGRVALVIGNSDYAHGGRLANPANDAAAVARSLRRVGFDVVARNDLNKVQLEDALKSFSRNAAGADVALIYYAGHGIEHGGANYLIPVDATLAADTDIDFEAVPLDLVMRSVGGAAKLKIVILDACRDNPYRNRMRRAAGTRSIGQGLAKPPDPEEGDMLVAYAAEAGFTAEDGAGADSPFATALARHLVDSGVDIRIMFGRVRDEVRTATQNRQEPTVYESLGGEQFFMAPPAAPTTLVAGAKGAPHADARDVELSFWRSVEDSGDAGQLNAYLTQYPLGAFAPLARAKIASLAPPAAPAPQAPTPTPSAEVATRGAPGAPGAFDGAWAIDQTCPASPDGAAGYKFTFAGEVKDGVLHGQRGVTDQPGWMAIDGPISADGSALLHAHGLTGRQQYSINRAAAGSSYDHVVTAHFTGGHGEGHWSFVRTCDFVFSRG
jgi:Caspase domain